MLTYFVYAPLLVLVFLGFCRLLFGKTPLCKQKSSVQDAQPSTTSVVLFSLSGCACVAHVLRVRSATHARLSRFSTLALRLIISLFQTRSAPCPRLSRLLPFALWQVTSLQAKSNVQDVQPSTTSVVLFSLSGCACVAHVLRVRSAPCPRLPRLVRLAPRLVNV